MKISQYIGNTPLVELNESFGGGEVKLFAKLEGNNPAGSVKDRPAFNMVVRALERGDLKEGDTLVEATSGNTGIALAMAAQLNGVKVTLVMPDNATPERVKTMRAYGAEVLLTPAAKTIEYSRTLAEEMSEKEGYKILNQFANDDNWKAHFESTGPEIWRDTAEKVTHFISAMGTTGTIMGVSRFLKSQNKSIQIVGAQPVEGSRIPGIRRWSEAMRPKIFDPKWVDTTVDVSQEEAIAGARRLASHEGILAGMSSGGAYHIAKKIAKTLNSGTLVFIACDRGDRYLSSELY